MYHGAGKGQKKCGRKEYVFFVTKKHFILERETFKDNKESYANILVASSLGNLFNKRFVKKLETFIPRLHRKRAKYINQMKNYLFYKLSFNFIDIKIIFFVSYNLNQNPLSSYAQIKKWKT